MRRQKKLGAEKPPLRELFKFERSPFWAADEGYERNMSGRIFSFPGVDMGYPDINMDSPVYPKRLSQNILPLRPSREIMTVPTVNIMHYRSNSACGWEPHIKGTT
eukprot:6197624-Pleurochrysis_carterae.AAC.1